MQSNRLGWVRLLEDRENHPSVLHTPRAAPRGGCRVTKMFPLLKEKHWSTGTSILIPVAASYSPKPGSAQPFNLDFALCFRLYCQQSCPAHKNAPSFMSSPPGPSSPTPFPAPAGSVPKKTLACLVCRLGQAKRWILQASQKEDPHTFPNSHVSPNKRPPWGNVPNQLLFKIPMRRKMPRLIV